MKRLGMFALFCVIPLACNNEPAPMPTLKKADSKAEQHRKWLEEFATKGYVHIGPKRETKAFEMKASEGSETPKLDWVQLFNGKDLTGWKKHPDAPGKWEVKEGAIVSSGSELSFLFSERDHYDNFHFRIEAKVNDKGDSGQWFRTKFGSGTPKGYEAQISSSGMVTMAMTGTLTGKVTISEKLVEPDAWFTQEVIAEGNRIQILVNGRKTVDYKDERNPYSKGHFAIQHRPIGKGKKGGGDGSGAWTIYVKKAEVKELPPSKK